MKFCLHCPLQASRADLHCKLFTLWCLPAAPWLYSSVFTAHRPCASQTTASATRSATPAQTAVLTWGWEVTFGWEMWCTVRSTPNRGTKAQVVPLKPPCPLAIESAVPYLSHSGCRGLLVFLKAHLIWLRYRPRDGAWRWTPVNDMAEDVLFLITFNYTLQYYDSLSCLSCTCIRMGALFLTRAHLHSLFRLILALMMHSCHGLKPHYVVLRPDLHNDSALDKLSRTDSEDLDNHSKVLLT